MVSFMFFPLLVLLLHRCRLRPICFSEYTKRRKIVQSIHNTIKNKKQHNEIERIMQNAAGLLFHYISCVIINKIQDTGRQDLVITVHMNIFMERKLMSLRMSSSMRKIYLRKSKRISGIGENGRRRTVSTRPYWNITVSRHWTDILVFIRSNIKKIFGK